MNSIPPVQLPASTNDKPGKFVPATKQEKKKTSPSQADSDETSGSFEASSAPPVEPPSPHAVEPPSRTSRIFVKPENLTLFAAMFPTDKGQTRSFSWKHFLQAMVDAGFSVTQGSGSALSFKNDCGVMVFHQPHPEPTIDPVVLLSMGKRLRKWFGWGTDVFAVMGANVLA